MATPAAKQALFWIVTIVGAVALFPLIPRDTAPGLVFSLTLLISLIQWLFVWRVKKSQDRQR